MSNTSSNDPKPKSILVRPWVAASKGINGAVKVYRFLPEANSLDELSENVLAASYFGYLTALSQIVDDEPAEDLEKFFENAAQRRDIAEKRKAH